MAELGTAVVRVIPDMDGLNARVAGYFSSSQWSKLGKSAGLALGAGLAAGGVVKGLYEIGQAFDDANDKIRVGTGKTGKALKGLEDDFKSVAKHTASDLGTTADAITDLNRRLGLTGKPLRRLSKQFLDLSRMTGTDLGGNIETVSRAFKDWEVSTKRQSKVLNGFFRLGQKTGITVDEIAESVQRFGSPLRQLGFSLGEAASLFANFEQAGVNTQTMVPGLKLAIANLTQPTADLAGKMDQLGIAAGKPEKGLRQVLSILGDESRGKVERISLAMDVFGKRAGSDMKEAIEQGRFSVDKLLKTFRDDQGDSIGKAAKATADFSEHWQKFKNKVMVGLEPLAKSVFEGVSKEAQEMFKILGDPKLSLGEKLEKVFGEAMQRLGEIAPKLAKAFVTAWWNAGVWAKLATFAFVAWKVGAIKALGSKVAGWFAGKFIEVVGGRIATATLADGFLGGKFSSAKWSGLGKTAGKLAGRGLVVGIVAGIALYGDDIAKEIKKHVPGADNSYTPGTSVGAPPSGTKNISESLIGIDLGFRRGGKVRKFAAGGVLSAVSSGELLAFPDGSTVQVPGQRVAADNVLTNLPVGTAVFTGHGQQLLAGGASPAEALMRQMPHFVSGGVVAEAAKQAGFRGSALLRMVAEAGGESGWNERAVGDGGASKGLWQIHTGWNPWARNMRLFDPFVNAKAARRIFESQGFGAWHADHTPWIGRARQAIAQMAGGVSSSATAGRSGPTRLGRGAVSDLRHTAFERGRSGAGFGSVLGALSRAVRDATPQRTASTGVLGGTGRKGMFGGAGRSVPGNLISMARKAASISSKNFAYKWGGGHNAAMSGPFDCSGAVSAVLDAGGYGGMPLTSGGFMNWGQPGRGRYVSLYTGPSHVFMRLGNRYFGTSGQNPGGGANWIPRFPGMPSGGVLRHPKGLRRGGMVGFQRLPRRLRMDPRIVAEFERTGLLPGFRTGGISGGSRGGNIANPRVLEDFLQILHLAGRIARQADQMGRAQERLNLNNQLSRAQQGIDPSSLYGQQLAAQDLFGDRRVMERRLRKLRRARELAVAGGDREAVKTLNQEIAELNAGVKEATISWIEAVREATAAAFQQQIDLAGARTASANIALEGLGLQQQLAGTFDTDAGRKARAAFINSTVIPSIKLENAALSNLMKDKLQAGDVLAAKDLANQIGSNNNSILQLQLDARELLTTIADNTSALNENLQEQLALLKEQLRNANLRFRVSQAQYGVFAGMPHFAEGGVVPGPVGAPRPIVAHGGEVVIPTNARGQGIGFTVLVEDGAVDPSRIRVIAQDEMRRSARSAGRRLPGRGGGVLVG